MPYRLATPQYSNYYDILANFTHFIKHFCTTFVKFFIYLPRPLKAAYFSRRYVTFRQISLSAFAISIKPPARSYTKAGQVILPDLIHIFEIIGLRRQNTAAIRMRAEQSPARWDALRRRAAFPPRTAQPLR